MCRTEVHAESRGGLTWGCHRCGVVEPCECVCVCVFTGAEADLNGATCLKSLELFWERRGLLHVAPVDRDPGMKGSLREADWYSGPGCSF